MKNEQVIKNFIEGKVGKNWTKNLKTDGYNLYSYKKKIAEKHNGVIYLFNYAKFLGGNWFSITTSCHISKTLTKLKEDAPNNYHIIPEEDYKKIIFCDLEKYVIPPIKNIILSYLTIKY